MQLPQGLNNFIEQIRVMPSYKRNRIIAGALVGFVVILLAIGFLIGGGDPCEENPNLPECGERVTLEFWDLFDNDEVYFPLIREFREKHPNITVNYIKKEDFGGYQDELVEALAAGEGPDIYAIHHSWVPTEQSRIAPMNDYFKTGENPATVMSEYPDVVRFDFVREDPQTGDSIIYALPTYMDTLALYYNIDYYNSHNYLQTPETWEEFIQYVKQIRRVNEAGEIELAAAALGGSTNVHRSMDILAALMLQAGAPINIMDRNTVDFGQEVTAGGQRFNPAYDGFEFYTSFADPASDNYTWNPDGIYSIDAFVQGRAAMMLNYSHQRKLLREKNPNLRFAVGPLPQPANRFDKVNYANYTGLAVAKNSKNPSAAWEFVRFITMNEDANRQYLELSDRPPALKSLLDDYRDHPELGAFASQALTAKSWRRPDSLEAENILEEAITKVLNDEASIPAALDEAARRINLFAR